IASTPTDLRPVLDAVIASAVKLAGATQGHIRQYDGELLRYAAHYGLTPEQVAFFTDSPFKPDLDSAVGRAFLGRRVDHVRYAQVCREPGARARRMGARTMVAVPLLREGTPIGVLNIWRSFVEPFTERQIELVRTFADQAVIAIENVRLFKELQARNAEVTEALEQQTATAEVLRVISRSTFDLETVLQTLMDNAAMLCRTHRGVMFRRDGDVYRVATRYNATPELGEYLQSHWVEPNRATITGRSIMEKRPVHVQDVLADSEYQWGDAARLGSYRTVLSVPLLREGEPMG